MIFTCILYLLSHDIVKRTTATKKLGCLLALRVWGVLWTGLYIPVVATKGAKKKVGLMGAVDRPKDRAITLNAIQYNITQA